MKDKAQLKQLELGIQFVTQQAEKDDICAFCFALLRMGFKRTDFLHPSMQHYDELSEALARSALSAGALFLSQS